MTDEKIINLAREYRQHANYPFEDITEAKLAAMDVLKWLSQTHCIVEKSDIKRYYKVDKCTIRDHRKRCGDKAQTRAAARIRLCESLFGKELFNNTEK